MKKYKWTLVLFPGIYYTFSCLTVLHFSAFKSETYSLTAVRDTKFEIINIVYY